VKLFNHVHILHQTPDNIGIANEVIAGHIDKGKNFDEVKIEPAKADELWRSIRATQPGHERSATPKPLEDLNGAQRLNGLKRSNHGLRTARRGDSLFNVRNGVRIHPTRQLEAAILPAPGRNGFPLSGQSGLLSAGG
jgi:hypothetical protein